MASRILSGPTQPTVQPACQQEMPVFIGFHEHQNGQAEILAGALAAHPAI
jgi:hypothetical protein